MACTACPVCLISNVSGCSKKAKNDHGKGSTRKGHKTKLEQSRFSLDIYGVEPSTFLRYLWRRLNQRKERKLKTLTFVFSLRRTIVHLIINSN